MVLKDYINGVDKVKRIMTKTVYVCRICGLSHLHYRAANICCAKQKQYRKETI